MSASETFAHRVQSARKTVSRARSPLPASITQGRPAKQQKRSARPNKEQRRKAIVAAWRDWGRARALQKSGDADIHAFLRQVKTNQPDLLDFASRPGSYEIAFGWIVKDKACDRRWP
jgi:hypothetical protein